MRCDLALIHPPSVFDFRREVTFPGPISEVVPSAYVFDMYPYGFLTLASWLESRGFRVGLFNLAAKMLLDREFDPVDLLSRVEADVFGIDLHWMVHAHGALEVARIVKELHPDSLVVLGGLSATYYWREVMEGHPYVDAVLRGDSTEPLMEALLERVEG
ncbi:MAG: TIGR04190 family B12-binding domain/radical SAM domain protein, partial [Thermoproteota archaeon]